MAPLSPTRVGKPDLTPWEGPGRSTNSPPATVQGPARVLSRKYHPRSAGLLYILTTIILVLGAINGQNNLLFFIFGLAVAGLAISGVLSGSPLMGLEISREVPEQAAVGEPFTIRYALRSRTRRLSSFALEIEEFPVTDARVIEPAVCDHLPASSARSASATLIPSKRGPLLVDRLRVSTLFPFGLARKSVTYAQPDRVWVRPIVEECLPAVFRRSVGHQNASLSVRSPRGGDEFFALREYVAGDTPRSIAWRSSARTGRLVVRQWSESLARRAWIVLDLSSARTNPQLAERIISVGAGLIKQAMLAGLEVGCTVREGPTLVTPRAGIAHFHRVLDSLARLDLNAIPHTTNPPFGPRDSLVLVTAGASASPNYSTVLDVTTLPPPATPAPTRGPAVEKGGAA